MTISVGLLEIGELGERYSRSLLKSMIITCAALAGMAVIGFNVAFAPTLGYGLIGNPLYGNGFFLGGFSSNPMVLETTWWSTAGTGLDLGTYFLFETAFAAVTLALVGVVVLRKMKMRAFALFTIPYFVLIWDLPAAWIWNPDGWLAKMGMVDFAGGLVVHGAAGAAGLALLVQIWREEKARGLTESEPVPLQIRSGWLTLAVLLLWVGWFGFNPGSVLQFNWEAVTVVLTTFLAAGTSFLSLMAVTFYRTRKDPGFAVAANGVLMGLIVITPLAGYVSPASAIILGVLCGPLFYAGEWVFSRQKWFSDPVGLLPGHLVGGLFGVLMIPFFTQSVYALGSGAVIPNGLLFGGGMSAVHQLGVEAFGIVVVMATVFALSFAAIWAIAKLIGGVTHWSEPLSAESEPGSAPVAL
jgi:Amt family ammonium transporter